MDVKKMSECLYLVEDDAQGHKIKGRRRFIRSNGVLIVAAINRSFTHNRKEVAKPGHSGLAFPTALTQNEFRISESPSLIFYK